MSLAHRQPLLSDEAQGLGEASSIHSHSSPHHDGVSDHHLSHGGHSLSDDPSDGLVGPTPVFPRLSQTDEQIIEQGRRQSQEQSGKAAQSRLLSLDVFRGITMVGMILVDNQGGDDIYPQLDEDIWNGIRMCNVVFPWFLFIMGVAIPIALRKDRENLNLHSWLRILKRVATLFTLGLLFNIMAARFHAHFRILGVLQRLAICYAICAPMFLLLPLWARRLVTAAFAMFYWTLMYAWKFPGSTEGACAGLPSPLTPDSVTPFCNACAYIDLQVFTQRFMHNPTDPEGLLSTCGAVITTYFGMEFGILIQQGKEVERRYNERMRLVRETAILEQNSPIVSEPISPRYHTPDVFKVHKSSSLRSKLREFLRPHTLYAYVILHLAVLTSLCFLVGGLLTLWEPLNKRIWSISFALVTAGLGLGSSLVLWILMESPDSASPPSKRLSILNDPHSGSSPEDTSRSHGGIRSHPVVKFIFETVPHALVQPLIWLGRNPILVFILMILLEILMLDWVGSDSGLTYQGEGINLWGWIYWHGFASWISDTYFASLLVSFIHLALWIFVAWVCDRRKWYFKV